MASQRVLQSLKSQNNCSNFNTPNFVIDEQTKLNDDNCYNRGQNMQNDTVNDYMLSNYVSCDCSISNVLDVSTKNRGLTVKDGYGVSECNINRARICNAASSSVLWCGIIISILYNNIRIHRIVFNCYIFALFFI